MYRTRQKSTVKEYGPSIAHAYVAGTNTTLFIESRPRPYVDWSSTITDDATNPLGFNNCDHLRVEWDKPSSSGVPRAYNSIRGYEIEFDRTAHYIPYKGVWAQQRPELDFRPALEELERNARGDMNTNVNLVVNAAEVVELKSLAKSVCSAFRILTRRWRVSNPLVRSQLKGRKRKGKRTNPIPSLQELADGHLAYSFGIAPLMRDIGSFLEINQKIRDRREELRNRSLIPTRINARVTQQIEYEVSNLVSGHPMDWPEVNLNERHWIKARGIVSAVCSAFYNLDSPSLRWKHVSQALGLTTPLTSIWNLTPFTFVADWFFPIGAAIKRVERAGWDLVDEAAVTTAYTLTDYHCSIKYEGVSNIDTWTTTSVVPKWCNRRLCSTTQRWSHYSRSAGMPATTQWWPEQSSDWSVSRTALSVSLALQRFKSAPKPMPKKWPSLSQIYVKAKRAH